MRLRKPGECVPWTHKCIPIIGEPGCLTIGNRALSVHGRSFSYDDKASGFGRGEGAACLLIKPLDAAVKAGDPIHAVIRNTACNHGGRSEGITMPNGVAHRELLRSVHAAVGLDPAETGVIEVRDSFHTALHAFRVGRITRHLLVVKC